jgi:ElaA protein
MKWISKSFDNLTTSELYQVLRLRAEIFVVEQDCVYQDVDNKDQDSYHICGYDDGLLAAYARVVKPGISYAEISIGRVVVSEKRRGIKLGDDLMKETISFIDSKLGVQPIRISAQSHLNKFYSNLGFVATGKKYLEDGIPHIEMLKS